MQQVNVETLVALWALLNESRVFQGRFAADVAYAAHFCSNRPCSSLCVVRTLAGASCIAACSISSLAAALVFSRLRYVCHPIAITPPNMLRYSIGM